MCNKSKLRPEQTFQNQSWFSATNEVQDKISRKKEEQQQQPHCLACLTDQHVQYVQMCKTDQLSDAM